MVLSISVNQEKKPRDKEPEETSNNKITVKYDVSFKRYQIMLINPKSDVSILLSILSIYVSDKREKVDNETYEYTFDSIGNHNFIFYFKSNLTTKERISFNCENMSEINFSEFLCEQVNSMKELFLDCDNLKK